MPDKTKFVLNDLPIEWDAASGTCQSDGIGTVSFWIQPSLANLLLPLADEMGTDLYRLLVAYHSSAVMNTTFWRAAPSPGESFPDRFTRWAAKVAAGGWGSLRLTAYDEAARTATVVVDNPWELQAQADREESFGCPYLQGRLIGIFSLAFDTTCWAEEVVTQRARAATAAEFSIHPSERTLADELKRLREARERTTADDVALRVENKIRARQRNEPEWTRLVDSNLFGVMVSDETGLIYEANDEVLRILGLGREDLPFYWMDVTPAKWLPRDEEAGKALRREGFTGPWEKEFIRSDGTRVPVLVGLAALEPRSTRAAVFVLDLSDLRNAEKQLELTEFSVQRSQNAVFWVGPDARFRYVNEAACRGLGYSRAELEQMTVLDISPGIDSMDVWNKHWAELKAVGSLTWEAYHRRQDGSVFPVEINANYMRFRDEEYNFAFVTDITHRRQAEQERALFEEQIRQVQRLESIGLMAGSVAHGFNNVLTGMMGNAALARASVPSDSPAARHLRLIEKASLNAASLCNQMLAYAGKAPFAIEPANLSVLVGNMLKILEISISKKARLHLDLANDLPAIEIDPTQVSQVVMNLITNASEALGEHPGHVRIATGAFDHDGGVREALYFQERLAPGPYVFVEVEDTGSGMDEDTQTRIFDPFFTTKFEGRGLGLAATMGIVRGHHGAVEVESQLGRGTVMRVMFPATDADANRSAAVDARPRRFLGEGTVLFVDDDEAIREVALECLGDSGFAVLPAADGQEAVTRFEQDPDVISVIILDMTMPELNGAEVLERVRAIRPNVPVVLTSGYDATRNASRLGGFEVSGFLAKPYRPQDLINTVRAAIAGRYRH